MSDNARTHVTFVTELFNTEEAKDYFINPNCFGDDCAQWLIDGLISQRIEDLDKQPTQEDWGWLFSVTKDQRNFLIGVGLCEDDEAPNTWLVFIKSQLTWFGRRLFGRSDEVELSAVCVAVDRALKSASEISDIRWHREEDWMKGRDQDWSSDPTV